MSIIWTIYTLAGGCRHQSSLTPAQIERTTRLNWISQPMCVGGLTTGKISIACLIYRLQSPTRWRTKLLIGLCSFMCALNSVCIILMFTQCRPVELLWKHVSLTFLGVRYFSSVALGKSIVQKTSLRVVQSPAFRIRTF